MGPVAGSDNGEREVAGRRAQKGRADGRQTTPNNSPVGLGNQSPWSGEPWANHGKPDHGKSGKYPELRDGREVFAGVRVDPEAPGSMARVHVGSRVSGTRGTWKRSPPGLQPWMDDNQVHPGAEWVLQPVRDGEWWNVVESKAALSATAIHRKPACRQPKGCAGGGRPEDPSMGERMKLAVRAVTEGNLPPVMPQGNLVEVLGREVRQGSPGELMVESSPSRQRRPPCKRNKGKPDEAADAAALTYLLTPLHSKDAIFRLN